MTYICTGYIKRRIHIGLPAVKKDTKLLINKSINQLTSVNAYCTVDWKGERVFPPTEIYRYRSWGPQLGTGRYISLKHIWCQKQQIQFELCPKRFAVCVVVDYAVADNHF